MKALRICLLAVTLVVLGGCRPAYFGDAVPYPDGCVDIRLDQENCAAAMDAARTQLGLASTEIATIDVLTEDRCGDDRFLLCSRSSSISFPFRFTMRDGRIAWTSVFCIVDVPRPWCS